MKAAVLFRGKPRVEDTTPEKVNVVIRCIEKAISPLEPEYFAHLWGDSKTLDVFGKHIENIIVEPNEEAREEIYSLFLEKTADHYKQAYSWTPASTFGERMMAQISSSMSIERVFRLFKETKRDEHEVVVLSRPDLVLSEAIALPDRDNLFLVNRHGEEIMAGDYTWSFKESGASAFEDMHTDLKEKPIVPVYHHWINAYLNFCHGKIAWSNISVGENCEIFAHLWDYPEIVRKASAFIGEDIDLCRP